MPLDEVAKEDMQKDSVMITDFRQSVPLTSAADGGPSTLQEDLREKVSEGFCKGACTDWLRHVLGRTPNEEGYVERQKFGERAATAAASIGHTKASRVTGMAQVHETLEQTVTKVETDLKEVRESTKVSFDEFIEANGLWATEDKSEWFIPQDEQLRATFDQVKQRKVDALRTWNEYAEKKNTQGADVATWAAQQVALHEIRRKKDATSFERLEAVCGSSQIALSPAGDGGTSMDSPLCDMLSLEGLKPNRGLIIGYDLVDKGKETGHAISIFRESDSTYFLFDPNIGVFKATSAEAILRTAMTLIRYGYDDQSRGGTSSLGATARWTLFQRGKADPGRDAGTSNLSQRELLQGARARQAEHLESADWERAQQGQDQLRAASTCFTKYDKASEAYQKDLAAFNTRANELKQQYPGGFPSDIFERFQKDRAEIVQRETELEKRNQEWITSRKSAFIAYQKSRMTAEQAEEFFPGFRGRVIQ